MTRPDQKYFKTVFGGTIFAASCIY